ncbi:hypothetical protein VKT23_011955 [Stygiomarasmius scandens]|uniref:endo-polygalacturonase n=1 Tax=Marasmiellus scandens TaxID=2682957 RepID=A0ABR1J873_9AGAR
MKSSPVFISFALASAGLAAFNSASIGTGRYPPKIGKRCTGTISSLNDVEAAQECSTIVINSFTVTAGETFTLHPTDGATVTMTGDITFGFKEWEGPLMLVEGNNITFDGGGHTLNGLGEQYWDGLGGGGVTKPAPFVRVNHNGGSFSNVVVLNAPKNAVYIRGNGVTVSNITVDDSAGDKPNDMSDGKPAGHNTDGFGVTADDVTIENCVVMNQDNCLAVNSGSNIIFRNNKCSGGHGISIGSVASDTIVSDVHITGNTVSNSMQCFRIKTDADATESSVSGITYTDNTASGCQEFGVLITQSYPDALGTPGTGVIVSDITFAGTNTVSVDSDADRIDINCGSTSSCPGTWDFSGLTVTGGSAGTIKNADVSGGKF